MYEEGPMDEKSQVPIHVPVTPSTAEPPTASASSTPLWAGVKLEDQAFFNVLVDALNKSGNMDVPHRIGRHSRGGYLIQIGRHGICYAWCKPSPAPENGWPEGTPASQRFTMSNYDEHGKHVLTWTPEELARLENDVLTWTPEELARHLGPP